MKTAMVQTICISWNLGLIFAMIPMIALAKKTVNPDLENRCTVKQKAIVQSPIAPEKIVEIEKGHYFVDFGKAWFAGLKIHLDNPQDGQTLVVHLGESQEPAGRVNRQPTECVRYLRAEIPLKAGVKDYTVKLEGKDSRLMPKEIGAVMPFRFVELENAPEITKDSLKMLAAHYPFDDSAAAFRCSDEKINAIWELCKHTIKATSFGGVFVDGDRERLPYEADAYINQLGWFYCTTDTSLPRYSHEYLILNPTWPTEWILFSVLIAWDDYFFTGDTASLKAFYDDLKAKTLIGLAREDGLIFTVKNPALETVMPSVHYEGKKPLTDIVEWPQPERDQYEFKPINTVVNAFHCRSLQLMSKIAQVLGHTADAETFRAAYEKATASLNEKLFDEKKGIYLDAEGGKHSSLHANAFPLALDLVPENRRAKIVEFLKTKGMACSVYGAQFLMEALFDSGEADYAMGLMTADGDRSWTHMIERVGASMAMEAWDVKYKKNTDWNHAWGAAPANILPAKVLGVEPLEPGFAKIQIQPRLGKLEWAEGKVPTVRGPVTVKAKNTPTSFSLSVEIPENATARIIVPKRGSGKVTLDGQTATATAHGEELALDSIAAGKHEITVE